MITAAFIGQFGNQLWQYAIAKIVADSTEHAYTPSGNWLDKKQRPLTWSNASYLLQTPTIGRRRCRSEVEVKVTHWIDLSTVPKNVDVRLVGYFQRYELIKPWKDTIRNEWLKIHTELPKTDQSAVHIHIRRTDFVQNDIGYPALDTRYQCAAHTINEYAECIARFPDSKRIILVTDNLDDPFLDEFGRFGKAVDRRSVSWDTDFLTLVAANRLIISQSTFSWWAGFLGSAEKVVCPMFPGSHWWRGMHLYGAPKNGELDFPNAMITDEPRWEYVTH